MMGSPVVAVGTEKGLFLVTGGPGAWVVAKPQFLGWRVTALGSSSGGTCLAGTASGWYGPAVQRSDDLTGWDQVVDGPTHEATPGRTLTEIWRFAAVGTRTYVGVSEAGLFCSDDDGVTWQPVTGINEHETASRWQPGAGGLCAHAIVHHPARPERLWCGISAVGVLRSDDGGDTWQLTNAGVEVTGPDETYDIGYCVHALVVDPHDPDVLYRQDHRGMYRSDDGADSWQVADAGLPASFGFPLVHDRDSGRLFAVPQVSDEHRVPAGGRLRVYVSDDGAGSWFDSSAGLPSAPGYAGVLRGAMGGDGRGTVAFGTTSGEVFVTRDAGDTWYPVPVTLPRVLAVAVFDS